RQRRHDGNLQRQFEAQTDLVHDGPVGPHGVAEIEGHQTFHEGDELGEHRLIEAEFSPAVVQDILYDRAATSREAQIADVARYGPHEQEDEDRRAEERRDHQQKALYDVAQHWRSWVL